MFYQGNGSPVIHITGCLHELLGHNFVWDKYGEFRQEDFIVNQISGWSGHAMLLVVFLQNGCDGKDRYPIVGIVN